MRQNYKIKLLEDIEQLALYFSDDMYEKVLEKVLNSKDVEVIYIFKSKIESAPTQTLGNKIMEYKEYADLLGAYFNDNGVNMMHDDFFGHKANETQNMFDIVDEYVPDFTVLLHGGTNCTNLMLKPAYAPEQVKGFVLGVEERIKARCEESGIAYKIVPGDCGENRVSPTSFNLPSALYHMSGEPCVTFESNQGLTEDPYNMSALTHEEIYESHMILFEEVLRSVIRKG